MEEQLLLVNGPRLRKAYLDTWKWKEGEDGVFSVKTTYNTLQSNGRKEEYDEFKIL